jgi:hypothetical protein
MSNQLAVADLIAATAIVMGFGVTVITFRLQREAAMEKEGEPMWIARSDWLILLSILVSLLFVFFPLFFMPSQFAVVIARAGCFTAIVLQAGYIPSILAHYRLLFGKGRSGPRKNPEPKERQLVLLFMVLAFLAFIVLVLGNH